MNKQYLYRANGLTLRSEIELPELNPGSGEPAATIRYGDAPENLSGDYSRGPRYQAAAGEYLLNLPRIARYYVRHGREAIITPYPGAHDIDVRTFILSSVMGALVHQNGLLAMHASAVEVNGTAILFAGSSGVGKSTLAAAFHERGYPLVADDLCAISFDEDDAPIVHPGYRRLKLWADSLQQVGSSMTERQRVRVGLQKYSVTAPGTLSAQPLPVAALFLLSPRLVEEIQLRPLRGRSKIGALVRETYRRRMMKGIARSDDHFARCAAFARRVPVITVERPFVFDGLHTLVDRLERSVRHGVGPTA